MKPILTFIVLILTGTAGSAQQVVASSGNTVTADVYTLDWTLGEPAINTFTGSNLILTQGMHQAKLIVSSINEIRIQGLEISIYPNPVECYLELKVKKFDGSNLNFSLNDQNGHTLLNKVMEHNIEQVDMQGLPPGVYILNLFPKNNLWQRTYKVVKN
ncbi:MAG: T9SS type A sorting domain-containing protein [Prolixibacteraceae bacterium]|nr:T9SS type A sorting domain-containing protein [Prolixibacteraceae bacterium]